MKPSKRQMCLNWWFEKFFGLLNEYKKNCLVCNLLRCDIYYSVWRMESETKIALIVVGSDPEKKSHIFAVCASVIERIQVWL
jgi:hypothetical protein